MNWKTNTSLGAMSTLLLGAALALSGCAGSGEGEDTRGAPPPPASSTEPSPPESASTESEAPSRGLSPGESQQPRPDPAALRFDTGDIVSDRDDVEPGRMVMVRKSWARIHRAPDRNSAPVSLVFGNDVFKVEKQEGEWVQVRYGKNVRGWMEVAAVIKP